MFRRDHDHERYKQMKSSQNIQRLGHTKFTSCSTCIFCLATSCVDLSSIGNIRYPAEWTGVNVPVVFRMKIKISKSRLSPLISGIICLNLLKNKIFKKLAMHSRHKLRVVTFGTKRRRSLRNVCNHDRSMEWSGVKCFHCTHVFVQFR
jgi:hypothetical protein